MSAVESQRPLMPELTENHGRPTLASLFAAEVLRLRSRRLVKIVLAAGVILLTLVTFIIAVNSGSPSAADRARVQQQVDQDRAACLAAVAQDPQVPKDVDPSSICTFDASGYGLKQPYDFTGGYRGGVIGVAVGVAALLFLIGASAGGAEWSARTMPALLYWEPRRLRVMLVKTSVLAAFAVLVSFIGQVIWLLYASGLRAVRGFDPAPSLPAGYWSEVVAIASRGLLLAVLVALGAFALANLTRNTAAALGIGFIYFAVLENVVNVFLPRFSRWSLASNVAAFLNPGGLEVPSGESASFASSQVGSGSSQTPLIDNSVIALSNLRAGLLLSTVVVVFLVVATALFARRDIT